MREPTRHIPTSSAALFHYNFGISPPSPCRQGTHGHATPRFVPLTLRFCFRFWDYEDVVYAVKGSVQDNSSLLLTYIRKKDNYCKSSSRTPAPDLHDRVRAPGLPLETVT